MDSKEKLRKLFMELIDDYRCDEQTLNDEYVVDIDGANAETENTIKKYIEEFEQIMSELN